jgi:hypothetical protein
VQLLAEEEEEKQRPDRPKCAAQSPAIHITNMANGEFFSFFTFSYGPFRTVVLRKYLNSNSSSTSAKSPAHMAKIHNMYLRLNHKHWKKVRENTKVAIDNGLK